MVLGPKILVVEDDASILRLLSTLLRRKGYAVSGAETPARALSLAPSLQPDLVTVDFNMPGMNGVVLAGQLRRISGLESVPIILITSLEFPGPCCAPPSPDLSCHINKFRLGEELFPCVEHLLTVGKA